MFILPPKIDQRDQQKIVEQLRNLALRYCQSEWPDLESVKRDPQTDALFFIFARMMESIIQRLNKAPDKNLLSFLDLVGVQLLPPRVAKAPLTFTMAEGAIKFGYIRAGAQVAAMPVKDQEAVVFETEKDLTVILPKLVKAVSINSPDDKWRDHSPVFFNPEVKSKEEVFQGKTPIPHRLYLGSQLLSGLKEPVTIRLDITLEAEMKQPYPEPWAVKWYCFADGTEKPISAESNVEVVNLLRNGSITFPNISGISEQEITDLAPDPGTNQKRSWKNYWLFAELNTPLPADPDIPLPKIKTIHISILNVTTSAYGVGTISSNGAVVRGNKTVFQETQKLQLKDQIIANGQMRTIQSVESNTSLTVDSAFCPDLPEGTSFGYLLQLGTGKMDGDKTTFHFTDLTRSLEKGYLITADGQGGQTRRIVRVTQENNVTIILLDMAFENSIPNGTIFYCIPSAPLSGDIAFFNNSPLDLTKDFFPFGERPKLSDTFYIGAKDVFAKKGATVIMAVECSPSQGNVTKDEREAKLYWEFWNGKNWALLGETVYQITTGSSAVNPQGPYQFTDLTNAFTKDGLITFRCPQMETVKVNGEENYWLRIRIASGGYGKEATYKENTSVTPNTWDYVPPTYQPPALQGLTMSYQTGKPVAEEPEMALIYNNFVYQEKSGWTLTNNASFKSFQRIGDMAPDFYQAADSDPAFYLAFDQDISNLPVTLFLPFAENTYNVRNIFEFESSGPALKATSVRLKKVFNLKLGDIVEFRNSSNENEQRTLTKVEPAANTIFWGEELQKDFSGYGSTIELLSVSPVIVWEYWNGIGWTSLNAEDQTDNFTRMEMVQFYAPKDITSRYLFGETYHWIRARLEKGVYANWPELSAIYTNTVWAYNRIAITEEVLGSSDGQPGQIFKFSKKPILPEQVIMIRELALTEAERQLILEQKGKDAIVEVLDGAGNIKELWVRWEEVNNFYASRSDSRHYCIDRINGTITFGDAVRGMIPPAGKDNIKCSRYQAGGGLRGNVATSTINQLRTAYPYIDSVTNPVAADGGCEQENLERARERGPFTIKHRERAVTSEDFEWLVREASLKIAKVKCLPTTDPFLEYRPGYITIIIVPESDDPKPLPGRILIREIEEYIFARTSTYLTLDPAQINLVGPGYIQVGISATVKYTSLNMAKIIEGRIIDNLKLFLNPLRGGIEKQGWDFGRPVYISELYQLIEQTEGVDYITELKMQSSVQLYSLQLEDPITTDQPLSRLSTVAGDDGRISLLLAEAVSQSFSRINVIGFKEDDRVRLTDQNTHNTIDLVIKSVSHGEDCDILEFEPSYTGTKFSSGSTVVTIDQRTRSYMLEDIPADSEISTCKIAVFKPEDKIMLKSRDNQSNTKSGIIKEIQLQSDTIFIGDNCLVYSGTHRIDSAI